MKKKVIRFLAILSAVLLTLCFLYAVLLFISGSTFLGDEIEETLNIVEKALDEDNQKPYPTGAIFPEDDTYYQEWLAEKKASQINIGKSSREKIVAKKAFIAKQDIPVGTKITKELVIIKSVPIFSQDNDLIEASNIEFIENKIACTFFQKGTPILSKEIAFMKEECSQKMLGGER